MSPRPPQGTRRPRTTGAAGSFVPALPAGPATLALVAAAASVPLAVVALPGPPGGTPHGTRDTGADTLFAPALAPSPTDAASGAEPVGEDDAAERESVVLAATGIQGRLLVTLPEAATFTVHGTLPLPPGVLAADAAEAPFKLALPSGVHLTTQVEVVTRHPSVDGQAADAQVVELLARVERPASMQPGELLALDLVAAPSPRPAPPGGPGQADRTALAAALTDLPAATAALLEGPLPVLLAAKDAYGHVYVAPLDHGWDGARWQRYGPVAAELRHHATMRPLWDLPGQTLPHLFGVHAYLGARSGAAELTLDLRVHNGSGGLGEAGGPHHVPLDRVYFRQLSVVLPPGWGLARAFDDPAVGDAWGLGAWTVWPLVEGAPGELHVMPSQGQLERRLALVPLTGDVAADQAALAAGRAVARGQGLAFADDAPGLSSWSNPDTAAWFAQDELLPRLDDQREAFAEGLAAEADELEALLASGAGGSYPVVSGALGWAHPYGVAYGGMTGGDGIEFTRGVDALVARSLDGWRALALEHRMNTERQPNALFRPDGDPVRLEDWIQQQDGKTFVPFYFYMHLTGSSDPFGFDEAPLHQVEAVEAAGLEPAYQDELLAHQHHDIQHLVRYTGPAKALAWLGNDSLAKDDLAMQAELFRLSYHPYPNSYYGHVQSTGMLADRNEVDANPGTGFDFGRAEGWGLDAAAALYRLGDEATRERLLPWFLQVVDLAEDGQIPCSGYLQATVYAKILGGKYPARQVIEHAISDHGLRAFGASVLGAAYPVEHERLRAVLVRSYYGLVEDSVWDGAAGAPYTQTATASPTVNGAVYCGTLPWDGHSNATDTWQAWPSLAAGFRETGDALFLERAGDMFGSELGAAFLAEASSNLGNRAGLLAMVENYLAGP